MPNLTTCQTDTLDSIHLILAPSSQRRVTRAAIGAWLYDGQLPTFYCLWVQVLRLTDVLSDIITLELKTICINLRHFERCADLSFMSQASFRPHSSSHSNFCEDCNLPNNHNVITFLSELKHLYKWKIWLFDWSPPLTPERITWFRNTMSAHITLCEVETYSSIAKQMGSGPVERNGLRKNTDGARQPAVCRSRKCQ